MIDPRLAPLFLLALVASLDACAAKSAAAWVELKGHRFGIEVAQDEASRERGLMFREHMDADHGMLFVFPDSDVRSFWMKNTKIPLDMLFFDSQRRLVSVQQRVPPCQIDPCPAYPSAGPAQYVLELNAGEAEKLGVQPGDELQIHP